MMTLTCRWGLGFTMGVAALALGAMLGCSSSSGGTGTDAGGDVHTPPHDAGVDSHTVKNCVKPGTPNNSLGIGGYCDTHTACPKMMVPDAGPIFCTAGFPQTPAGEWFCTTLCDQTLDASALEQCGSGEVVRIKASFVIDKLFQASKNFAEISSQ